MSGLFLSRFGFGEPSSAEGFCGDAGEIGLDVEDGGLVEHVDASDVELGVFAAEEFEDGEADGVGAAGRCRDGMTIKTTCHKAAASKARRGILRSTQHSLKKLPSMDWAEFRGSPADFYNPAAPTPALQRLRNYRSRNRFEPAIRPTSGIGGSHWQGQIGTP